MLILYLLLALLGLTIGSFLNVVIYRLPLMFTENPINLWFPRSFCPNCKHMIPATYNIPLLSYFVLRGRCKQCQYPISKRYPLVESLTALLSLAAAWHFGFTLTLCFALPCIWLLIALFFIDLEQQLLPDCLTLSLLWLGLVANTQNLFTTLPNAVLSAVVAYLSLWCFIQLYYLCTKKVGMGNGDFKLFAALGAWFGWQPLALILLFASTTGAIIGGIYLLTQGKNKNTPIPFGPFLCLAGLINLFYGKSVIQAYLAWFYS